MGKKKINSLAQAYIEMKEGKISEEEFQEAFKKVGEMLKNFPYPEGKGEFEERTKKIVKIATAKKKKN